MEFAFLVVAATLILLSASLIRISSLKLILIQICITRGLMTIPTLITTALITVGLSFLLARLVTLDLLETAFLT